MYRYVLEKMLYFGSYLLHVRKDAAWRAECEPTRRILGFGSCLRNNSNFYPIDFESVEKLFFDFDEIPLPFPPQDDFPIVSLIKNVKLLELQQDISAVNLPSSCHEEFRTWLDEAVKYNQDLMLYYY